MKVAPSQLERVWNALQDGTPRTLKEISDATHDPQASVSARIRDLRKEHFGGHTINRFRGTTTSFYKLVPSGVDMDIVFFDLRKGKQ
jgi:hypothetical protein